MRLIYRITIRLALSLIVIMALWATLFYFSIVREINDESDDSLEEYSELIIRRHLAGRPLPSTNNGSNNSYTIEPIDTTADVVPYMSYHDEMMYIPEEEETEPARVLTTIFPDNDGNMYKLIVSMPTFERLDLIRSILWYMVILFFALMAVLVVVASLVINNSISPLYALLDWLDKYIPGRKVGAIPDSDIAEFHKLSIAAHHAVNRAEEYSEQQKQFIGNASHELQTPLAIIGNRLEWLVNNTTINEEQFIELTKMQQTLRGLVRLNRTLLLLSKIDNGQFPEVTDVDIVPIIEENVEIYKEIYAEKEIECKLSLGDKFIVSMNEPLANTLVTNLVKNAFLHSPQCGRVEIKIEKNKLAVSNLGESKLDSNRVFDRFYHSGATGSTGLGLALVSSIGRYYNIDIGYSFSDNMHIFTAVWNN